MIINFRYASQKLLFLYIVTLYIFSFRAETVQISELVLYLFAIVSVIGGLRRWDFSFKDFQWLISFASIAILSSVWAINKMTAFSSGVSIVILVIFTMLIYHDFDRYSINIVIIAILVAGAVSVFMSIISHGAANFINAIIQGKRLAGTMVAANTYGVYMAISSLCGLFLLLKYKYKLFTGICVALTVLGLLSSNSRNGFLVCIAGTSLFLFLYLKEVKLSKKIWSLVLVAVAIVLLYRYGLLDGILDRLDNASIPGEDRSVNTRLFMIEFGLKSFLGSPFWGYGINNAQFLLESYFARTYLHNNYIELLVDVGLIGFLTYYCCFISIITKLNKIRKSSSFDSEYSDKAILLFVICIMLLIADMSVVFYYNKMTYIIFGLSMAFIKQRNPQEDKLNV